MLDLEKRILEISVKHHLSHIGSNLTAVRIIDEIYRKKNGEDLFVLSQGHAGIAFYVVLEKYMGTDAESYLEVCGIHPCRVMDIICSTGSLGHGLPIAVGMAIADKTRKVYCLISDGECDEGSIWESFRIINEQKVRNIRVYVNINGNSAYRNLKVNNLVSRLPKWVKIRKTRLKDTMLDGVKGHYKTLTNDEKDILLQSLRRDEGKR